MKLKEKLKQKAEIELGAITRDAASALEGIHPAVTGDEIATLAFNKRTATLKKAVIRRMVAHMEEEILQQYSEQFEIVMDPPKEKDVA